MLRNDEEDGTEATIQGEKILGARAGVEDRRLLIYEPELAALLRRMHRSENILTAVLRDLWDRGEGGSWTRGNPLEVSGAHVSLITHITEVELVREFTTVDMANGFGNRILWVCAKRFQELPFGGGLTDEGLAPVVEQLVEALEFARTKAPEEYPFDKEVTRIWPAVYSTLERVDPTLVGHITTRSTPIVRRLAVIYAALDRSRVVKLAHIQAARAVWDYSKRSAEYLFGNSTGNPRADRIYSYALGQPDKRVTRTDITVDLFSRKVKKAQVDEALALLEKLDLMRLLDSGGGSKGRKAEIWEAQNSDVSSPGGR